MHILTSQKLLKLPSWEWSMKKSRKLLAFELQLQKQLFPGSGLLESPAIKIKIQNTVGDYKYNGDLNTKHLNKGKILLVKLFAYFK